MSEQKYNTPGVLMEYLSRYIAELESELIRLRNIEEESSLIDRLDDLSNRITRIENTVGFDHHGPPGQRVEVTNPGVDK